MTISTDMLQIVAAAMDASDGIVAVLEAVPGLSGGLRICEVGDAFLRFTGYGWMQLIDQPLGCIAAPEAADELGAIAAAVAGGVPWRGELLCLEQTGRRVWLGCHLMPGGVSAGQTPLFVLLGRDITSSRAESERARMLNSLLARSFLLADVPLAIVSSEGRFVMTNQALDAMLGQSAGALAGRPSLDSVAPPSRTALQSARERQFADGAPFRTETSLLRADGVALSAALSSTLVERSDRQRFRIVTARPVELAPAAAVEPSATLLAGRVRFISLDTLRESLGDRWQAVAERVLNTAEHLIRKRLDHADVVCREDGSGFTICFAHATEEAATVRATAIAREIRQHLIGRGEDDNGLAIQVAIRRVKLSQAEPHAPQIARQLDAAEAEIAHANAAPAHIPRLHQIYATGTALAIGVHAMPVLARQIPGAVRIPACTLSLDLGALSWAAALDPRRAPTPILLNLQFEMFLSRPNTEAYLEACRQIPLPIRQQLVFLLSPLPKGVTASLVQDIQRRLKPYSAGIGCRLDDFAPPAIDLRRCPMAWVAVDLAPHRGEPLSLDRLRRLNGVLGAYGARTLGMGTTQANFRALHEAGTEAAFLREEPEP